MTSSHEFIKKFNKNISSNIKLANYSWFNLGGPAEYLFKPENKIQLIEFLKDNRKKKFKITILGAGSNTLIRDKGIKGVVIKLGSNFSSINLIDKETIEVGAATLDRKISNFAKENGISGFEFLSCIPGTIGGGIRMNAGCFGKEFKDILLSVQAIDKLGNVITIPAKDIKFQYRKNNLSDDLIFLSASFKGIPGEANKIKKETER